MALLGKNVAFIPIGLSCQVAHQLKENRLHLSRILREPLEYRSSFFNWTLVSAGSIVPVMRRLVAGPPIRASDFHVPDDHHRTLKLANHGLWLWHETLSHDITDDDLHRLELKYEQMRRNFLELAERPRRYFILASSQNNMKSLYPFTEGDLDATLNDDTVAQIRREIGLLFPRGRNHLIVAGKEQWLDMRKRAHRLPEEPSNWQGEVRDWQAMFSEMFRLRRMFNRAEDRFRQLARRLHSLLPPRK